MTINDQLRALYNHWWDLLVANGQAIDGPIPANPMMLSLDDEALLKSTKLIMICGQETWGWDDFGATVAHSMMKYHRFFIDEEFYTGYRKSAFWKAFRFLQQGLRAAYRGQAVSFVWQNLSKLGRNDGKTGVTAEIRSLERNYFPVLAAELKILQPDVVVFLTGPNRDRDILFHFPDASFEQAGEEANLRKRAWVSSPSLPRATLRLYHPSYFRAWTDRYRQEAITLITQRGEHAGALDARASRQ